MTKKSTIRQKIRRGIPGLAHTLRGQQNRSSIIRGGQFDYLTPEQQAKLAARDRAWRASGSLPACPTPNTSPEEPPADLGDNVVFACDAYLSYGPTAILAYAARPDMREVVSLALEEAGWMLGYRTENLAGEGYSVPRGVAAVTASYSGRSSSGVRELNTQLTAREARVGYAIIADINSRMPLRDQPSSVKAPITAQINAVAKPRSRR